MARIRNSWELAKTSWGVLRADRELLWLPVLSFLSWLVVGLVFVVPILLTGQTETTGGSTEFELGPIGYVVGFVGYVALAYVTIFFRAAILHAADERLRGGDPTVGSAIRGASARAGRLLPWAIVATTVSLVLRAIEERAGFLGRIVAGFVGLAWTLVTFLVLPVLVIEDVGVIEAVKRAAQLFKRTWGENVAAQLGFGLIGFVAVLPGLLVGGLLAATGVLPLVVIGIAGGVAWIALVAVVMSALGAVYQMALYHYAVDGAPPPAFAATDLGHAFASKRTRGGGS